MTVIVDANITISGIVNPYGPIPLLLHLYSSVVDFVVPEYAIDEINAHKERICKQTKTSPFLFEQLKNDYLTNLLLFSNDSISAKDIELAKKLATSIDIKDICMWHFP